MNRHFKLIFALLMVVIAMTFMPLSVAADFGDFGGDSDYGGGGGGDSGYGGGSSYNSSSGGRMPGFSTTNDRVTWIIVVICMFIAIKSQSKKDSKGGKKPEGAKPTEGLSPITRLYQIDPKFSKEEITQRLSNLYVQMQNGWQAKDLSPLRGDFTDSQYAQYDRQLERYRTDGITNRIERIAVLGVELKGIKQDDKHDILVANLRTRVVDYVVEDKTGKLVQGSKTAEKFMTYEWTLVRPLGTLTQKQSGDKAFNCPNCGAPMDINNSAKCPYCESIVTKADYDWVISNIKGLSQETRGK